MAENRMYGNSGDNMMLKKNQHYKLIYRHYNLSEDFPIIGLTGANKWLLPSDDIVFLHSHNCLEIGYCHEGRGILTAEGREFRFSADDITMISQDTMHISKSDKGTTSRWEYLYLDSRNLTERYELEKYSEAFSLINNPEFIGVISGKKYPDLKNILMVILNELHTQPTGYKESVRHLSAVFLIMLNRIITECFMSEYGKVNYRHKIYPTIAYIEENYMNRIKTQELAEMCFMSETNFRRTFKSILGVSPQNYLSRVRMKKACEMMLNTDKSITEIAMDAGFGDSISLDRHFKRMFGVTPYKWRKLSRKNPANYIDIAIYPDESFSDREP